jgi:hypothetical protein
MQFDKKVSKTFKKTVAIASLLMQIISLLYVAVEVIVVVKS